MKHFGSYNKRPRCTSGDVIGPHLSTLRIEDVDCVGCLAEQVRVWEAIVATHTRTLDRMRELYERAC